MALYNPYREYDKGMDDAWQGKEPSKHTGQYYEGYFRSWAYLEEEDKKEIQKIDNQTHAEG